VVTLEINGKHTSISHSCILEAFFYAVKELMPRKKNLDIILYISHLEEVDITGYHIKTDRYTHEIEIECRQNEEDFLTAFFHELVHVRQTERGITSDESQSYYNRPTEIEAYHLQEELYKKWKYLQS
jgi:hypothetical protein